jgi:hypothetical protein
MVRVGSVCFSEKSGRIRRKKSEREKQSLDGNVDATIDEWKHPIEIEEGK